MPSGFNPLQDIATFLGNIAKALPTLPAPPFPLPKPPEVESPSGKVEAPIYAHDYVDITDPLMEASMKRHREEQAAKGLIVLNYE
ncbi:MAG: hypothetical protein ISS58_02890 [Dehalococcoidales bacterium]|nr:hypothetical protein [Dehalococcoidales bacterium]